MAKRYKCSKCKKSFSGLITLTRHIRACKSGKITRKSEKPVCSECGKQMKNLAALGAHRWRSHQVVGSSRRRNKKSGPMPVAAVKKVAPVAVPAIKTGRVDIIGQVAERMTWHRDEAQKHAAQADKLEAIIGDLRGALA